ncbi:hypothetical protein VNO77_02386 [Canavalia gladiata]|uniref:Uncharacterized protein n=1 Tax=Canavalia gladiata TaxID=3824 RepID=A0AAN9R767_CANGL
MPSLYHTYTPKTMTRPNAAIGAQQLFWISPALSTLAPENSTVMAGQGLSISYNCFRIANKVYLMAEKITVIRNKHLVSHKANCLIQISQQTYGQELYQVRGCELAKFKNRNLNIAQANQNLVQKIPVLSLERKEVISALLS